MTRWAVVLCLAALLATPQFAAANAPQSSPRPELRPGAAGPQVVPRARPGGVVVAANPGRGLAPATSPRPRVLRAGAPAAPQPQLQPQAEPVPATRAGSICRDRDIRGSRLAAIEGASSGCGIARPVRVTAVDGVRLSRPAIMECQTARALKDWVSGSVRPTVGRLGGGVASLRVAEHYACRTRNSQPGAPLSEHGKGRAVDISAIELENGVAITVQNGWQDPVAGQLLKKMHAEACGPFRTVLGPDADRFHQDHFHLDTAARRGRACR